MPHLFGLRDDKDHICAAFGLRTASRRLFLEQYLDVSIETAIATRTKQSIERETIVEIGHFFGSFAGAAREMIRLLTMRLRNENYAWVTFTGTSALRNAFARMGLGLIDIASADVNRLPVDARAHWGSYYDYAPRVMAGEINTGYAALTKAPLHPVMPSAHMADDCA